MCYTLSPPVLGTVGQCDLVTSTLFYRTLLLIILKVIIHYHVHVLIFLPTFIPCLIIYWIFVYIVNYIEVIVHYPIHVVIICLQAFIARTKWSGSGCRQRYCSVQSAGSEPNVSTELWCIAELEKTHVWIFNTIKNCEFCGFLIQLKIVNFIFIMRKIFISHIDYNMNIGLIFHATVHHFMNSWWSEFYIGVNGCLFKVFWEGGCTTVLVDILTF